MLSKYIKKILTALILITIVSGFAVPQPTNANTNTGWLNPTWQFRQSIVIDNSNNTLPLKNYILTINLDYANFDFYQANTSGYDFRFTLDDGVTLLDHDLEYYNFPKSARVKVKIPYAPAKLDSLIYFYYGAKTSVANLSQDLSQPVDVSSYLEIFDSGQYSAPSNWKIETNQIVQDSNIWSYDAPEMSGTYGLVRDSNFTQGDLTFEFMSKDDDGLGLVFGYQDANNYYRLAWYNDDKNIASLPGDVLGLGLYLQKKQNGRWSTLFTSPKTYLQNHWYPVKISLGAEEIKISINGHQYVNLKDNSFRGPKIGFYSWANQGSYFRGLGRLPSYENPNLYLPVSYRLKEIESHRDFLANVSRYTPSTLIKIAENENIYPGQIYYTQWPTPVFAGLVTYGLKVKLLIDNQIVADLAPKEGEKSGVANWSFWLKENLPAGEHLVYTIPYRPGTSAELARDELVELEPSPKIKFIVRDRPKPKLQPMSPPLVIGLGENPKVDMTRVYVTRQTQPTVTGLSPYGWPVRIYIDNQAIGNATVQQGETTGTSNWYIKLKINPGRHTLVAVIYNPETKALPAEASAKAGESRSPQVITFEVR